MSKTISLVPSLKDNHSGQLPTAELLLDGVDAVMVSEPGRGISSISSMLTISRLHNITASIGLMRKITSLARDFATRRVAFSQSIENHPLHVQTLARMEVRIAEKSV